MPFWGQKTYCVIAGASRGIGQGIAETFAKHVGPGSVLLLFSRTKSALESTKASILSDPQSNFASVTTTPIDLASPCRSALLLALQSGFTESKTDPSHFSQFILVQVAASLGLDSQTQLVTQLEDLPYMRNFFEFNLNSFILLNSLFSTAIKGGNAMIIQISSHGAVTPYKCWGLYCAARAAKESLLRSIALETPNIQTLNYAPGLVNTDNYSEALQLTKDADLLDELQAEKEKGNLLTPQQTAQRLVEILQLQLYTKGEHVSYHDYEEFQK